MRRNHAITVALIAAAAFAVYMFWPKEAGAGARVSVTGRVHLGDSVVLGARIGDSAGWGAGPRHRWNREHRGDDRWHGERSRRPVLIVPYATRERVIVREPVEQPPAPPVPAAIPPAAPSEPLDPRGQARRLTARGAGGPPHEWVLGDVLPADLPHVALDASAYGLPQPPDGQIYARVDGDVLRIEADSRRIVAVVAR